MSAGPLNCIETTVIMVIILLIIVARFCCSFYAQTLLIIRAYGIKKHVHEKIIFRNPAHVYILKMGSEGEVRYL